MALIAGVQYSGTPAGTILPCGKSSALPMTLLCDGTSYPTNSYPALFAVIGYSFGGSGANFNVPDFRGRFLRGVDGSASNDPDKASRTAMNTGGNTGNAVGSVQGHSFQSHSHASTRAASPDLGAGAAGTTFYSSSGSSGTTGTATATGAASQATNNETRPVNAYVNYCIAY